MTRSLFRLAGISAVLAIWILSLMPGGAVPDVPGNDKWHHSLAYFGCMFCWGQVYLRPAQRLKLAITFIVMGAVIECLQYFTPTRSFEFLDMLANSVGVAIAWLLVTIQLSIQRRWFPDSAGAARDK